MKIKNFSLVSSSSIIAYGYAALAFTLCFFIHDEWRRFTSPAYVFNVGANSAMMALGLIGAVAMASGNSIKRLEERISRIEKHNE